MRSLFIALIVTCLCACADSHSLVRSGGNAPSISRQSIFYVSVPKDGQYAPTVYSGSGQQTSQAIMQSFSKYADRVELGKEYEEFEQALSSAKRVKATYLLFPTILHWEDRATEWSGIPDKVSIKLSVVDTNSGKIIDAVVIDGKSGMATLGGDHPQDLLPIPLSEYAATVFN